ncbi:MAG TPA: hypothetical protein VIS27_03015 [Yeosuana sp.]
MKKFDFRRQLKDMNLEQLKSLRSYHLDYMLKFMELNDEASGKHSRYVSYIDEKIKKLQNA